MIKLEVNEEATTIELEGKIPEICTDLTVALIKVIEKNNRFASAVRMALIATGETEMPIVEQYCLAKTIVDFKGGQKE